MKRYSRDNSGVSPVIATILLVAITIVLVGILFIWVMAIVETPKEEAPNVNIALSTESDGEETYFKILITEIDDNPTLNNVKYRVYNNDGNSLEEGRADSEVYGNMAHMATYNDELLGVGFSDSNADGRLSVGDYFLVKQHFNKKYSSSIDVSGGGMSLIYTPNGDMLEDIKFTI